jgi:hypothetical protein
MVHAPAAGVVVTEPMKPAIPADEAHPRLDDKKVDVPKGSASLPLPSKGGDKDKKKKQEGGGFRAGIWKAFGGDSDAALADYDDTLQLEPIHDSE